MELKNYEVGYLKDAVVDRIWSIGSKITDIENSKENVENLSPQLKSHLAKIKEEQRLLELLKIKMEKEMYNRTNQWLNGSAVIDQISESYNEI